jgi:hypothetical protein
MKKDLFSVINQGKNTDLISDCIEYYTLKNEDMDLLSGKIKKVVLSSRGGRGVCLFFLLT